MTKEQEKQLDNILIMFHSDDTLYDNEEYHRRKKAIFTLVDRFIKAGQVEPVVKPEIAITIIKTKITQLEELAEKYKGEWDIESYTDCLGQRNTLKGVLTEIEKQFSV